MQGFGRAISSDLHLLHVGVLRVVRNERGWPLPVGEGQGLFVISEQRRRDFQHSPCRGKVVYNLSGGPAFKANLVDLGRGGARIALDRPMAQGAPVRLVFPRKSGETGRSGRVIVGQVVHSRVDGGRYVIGVAFGWHAAVKDAAQPLFRKSARTWFGFFSRRPRETSPASKR